MTQIRTDNRVRFRRRNEAPPATRRRFFGHAGVAWRGPITEASDAVSAENVATDMLGEILAGKPVDQAVRDAHQRAIGIYRSFGLKGM